MKNQFKGKNPQHQIKMSGRVVITSVGVISSLGHEPCRIMAHLRKDQVCFDRSPVDEKVLICPVRDFDVRRFLGRFKNIRYLTRGAQFCVAAAMAAVKNAALDQSMLEQAGLFVGTGPNLEIGGECSEIRSGKMDENTLQALWILKFLPNTASSVIASMAGINGENLTVNTACSASLQAIGEAFRKIRGGYLDMAFAGGGDSRLSGGGILAYQKAQALLTTTGEPEKAYAPFDNNREGFVPGEGGAFLLLEALEHAQKRGAKIWGEVCGYGNSIDGYNMTAPHPEGKQAEAAVRFALKEASMRPDQVDAISAHGTGTRLNDDMEACLIDRVYGRRPKVTALKSWFGHLSAACGALETAVSLFCMQHDWLPPVRNLKAPCHLGVNFVRRAIHDSLRTVMIENFGFGGQNAALLIRRWT